VELAALADLGSAERVWEGVHTLQQIGFVKVIDRWHDNPDVPRSFSLMVTTQGLFGLLGLATGKLRWH